MKLIYSWLFLAECQTLKIICIVRAYLYCYTHMLETEKLRIWTSSFYDSKPSLFLLRICLLCASLECSFFLSFLLFLSFSLSISMAFYFSTFLLSSLSVSFRIYTPLVRLSLAPTLACCKQACVLEYRSRNTFGMEDKSVVFYIFSRSLSLSLSLSPSLALFLFVFLFLSFSVHFSFSYSLSLLSLSSIYCFLFLSLFLCLYCLTLLISFSFFYLFIFKSLKPPSCFLSSLSLTRRAHCIVFLKYVY